MKILKINEIVIINGKFYRVGFKAWSNGKRRGESPNLTVYRIEEKFNLLSQQDKTNLFEALKQIELNKKDYPIKEEEVKFKDILSNVNKTTS